MQPQVHIYQRFRQQLGCIELFARFSRKLFEKFREIFQDKNMSYLPS